MSVSTLTLPGAEEARLPRPSNHLLLDPWDETWEAFAASTPWANIFHHPRWANLLAECYGYRPFIVVVRDAHGTIRAGLPMMEVSSPLTGRRWISLPFTDHCSPLYRDTESLEELTNSLVEISRRSTTPRIEVRWQLPAQSTIRSYSHFVVHTCKLDPDFDSVANRFHAMHRRNIKTARKRGVRIVWGQERHHLREFYHLHLQTRRRQGIPVQPLRFFEFVGALIEQGLGFVLLAYKDYECLAAAVFLHWHQTLTYKYGASSVNGLRLRPNNLLFSAAMRWGCENGYTVFDMGKTDLRNTGLRTFKTRWGAEETPLIYSTLSSRRSRRENAKLEQVMCTIIRNSPTWVCRAAGELLYGHFA